MLKLEINNVPQLLANIAGVAALCWNIFGWFMDNPKLRVNLKFNMLIHDGYCTLDLSGNSKDQKHMYISIANVGKRATTINLLCIQPYTRTFPKLRHDIVLKIDSNKSFPKYTSAILPFVLEPGKEWFAVVTQEEDIVNFGKDYDLMLEVQHSHNKNSQKTKIIPNVGIINVKDFLDAENVAKERIATHLL